jgi:subtilase family serine protease
LASAILVVTVSGAAQAQSATGLLGPLPIDKSVARERSLYQKLHIQDRYGIVFHPYASVCRGHARKSANCAAKIVTDDSGTPLTFDPAKQDLPGYSPKELRAAYGVSGVATGQPILGIVDAYADPSALDDLKAYSKQFNLPVLAKCKTDIASSPVPCLQIVNQKGGNKLPTTVDVGWMAEQSLDLDASHALCENCSILLVEADSNQYGDLLPSENTAANLGANSISNSWGNTEASWEGLNDTNYFTHPGVAMTAATGDNGYAGGVWWPASSPDVVAAGGTSLFLSKNGKKYSSEVAWAGAGSGCSAYEARPSWQPILSGCPNNRTVSDISMDADPNTGITIYDSNGCTDKSCWYEEGGTSLSAPMVAALYALAGPLGDDHAPADLYTNVSKQNSHDIVSGSTGTCAFAYLCNAVAGYDGPTGLGSPKGLGIFEAQP